MEDQKVVRVAADLHDELTTYCNEMGVTMTRTVAEAIRDFLEVVAPARREAMRVSQREILRAKRRAS